MVIAWEEQVASNCQTGVHAALSYEAVVAAGPAARPLEFPTPTVSRGLIITVPVYDHRSGLLHNSKNVLMRVGGSPGAPFKPPDRAYLVRKQLARSIYGVVYQCVVLRRRARTPAGDGRQDKTRIHRASRFEDPVRDQDVEWESTEQVVAAKVSKWSKIRHLRGQHLEDPIKEIAALQLVGDYHPNISGSIEALQDEVNLYMILPYCSGGDLYGRIFGHTERKKSRSDRTSTTSGTDRTLEAGNRVDERRARHWFRQLLQGLFHLQKKGVCHRDLSLENIVVDDKDRLKIIDFGMSLRVPYTDLGNVGCVTDVSAGTMRRLIVPQGQGGKLMYVSPEVLQGDEPFDGFAIDLWSAGTILFIMLVGVAPFKWANSSDNRFTKITKGHLRKMLHKINVKLSEEACDLLQNMFWCDPRKRLTLEGIMKHPWVLDGELTSEMLTSSGAKKGSMHDNVLVGRLAHV